MTLQLASLSAPILLEATKLHETYIETAAKPERPELVRQQLRAASADDGPKIVSGTHDALCSKLQDGCPISDQAGLASWMKSFGGQCDALSPREHPAS